MATVAPRRRRRCLPARRRVEPPESDTSARDARADVLVHPEEVLGIVLGLDLDQALVIRAERLLDHVLALFPEEVEQEFAIREARHRVRERAGPRDVRRRL